MAKVTVPADDAVRGRFPAVCARTGAPADGRVELVTTVGGPSSVAWLLLLLGPFAWLILAALALAGGEHLSVRLPFAAEAWDRVRRVGIAGYVLVGLGVAGLGAAALVHGSALAVVANLALVVVGGLVVLGARAMLPVMTIDVTRRWVTIRHAHPGFCAAVRAEAAPHRANS